MAVGTDAFQARNRVPAAFQLHQRRTQPGATVAKAPQNLIAGHAAPQLRPRKAAAGDDEPVALHRLVPGDNAEAGSRFLHFFRFKSQLYRDIRLFQRKPQHIHHGICLIGIGVHPPGILRHGEKPQTPEPFQRRRGWKLPQRIVGKPRIFPVVAAGCPVEIG